MERSPTTPPPFARPAQADAGIDAAAASADRDLRRLLERLAEAERAHGILRAKGYGKSWLSLDEIARLVPDQRTDYRSGRP